MSKETQKKDKWLSIIRVEFLLYGTVEGDRSKFFVPLTLKTMIIVRKGNSLVKMKLNTNKSDYKLESFFSQDIKNLVTISLRLMLRKF